MISISQILLDEVSIEMKVEEESKIMDSQTVNLQEIDKTFDYRSNEIFPI